MQKISPPFKGLRVQSKQKPNQYSECRATSASSTRTLHRAKIQIISKSCDKPFTPQQTLPPNPANKRSFGQFFCCGDETAKQDTLAEINMLMAKKSPMANSQTFSKSRQEKKNNRMNHYFRIHGNVPLPNDLIEPSTPINKLVELEDFA